MARNLLPDLLEDTVLDLGREKTANSDRHLSCNNRKGGEVSMNNLKQLQQPLRVSFSLTAFTKKSELSEICLYFIPPNFGR